jgi:peptidoglycan/LPS O-acetylase OafA/YrhL
MTFSVLGLALRYFSRPSALARYLADSSYWIYLVHLPLVLFIGGLLALLPLPAVVKWTATLVVATPILLLSYRYLVRFTPIGELLNGQRHRAKKASPS